MIRIISTLIIAFSFITIKVNAQEKKQKINYEKEGYVKAEVIDYKVDGCRFLIELSDKAKTKITPDKLDEAFKKDKEKIWIKYSLVKKQLPSTCMAGKQAEVVDIQKRK
jgi:hypothetical protein